MNSNINECSNVNIYVYCLTVQIIMVALCNRADHYILSCGFFFYLSIYLSLSSFFPRLMSAVADWMSAILPHSVALVRI